jgi:type I restriction enzyme S subunit
MWCFRVKPDSYIKQVFVKYMLDSIVEKSMGLASGSAREFFRKGDFGNQNICSGSESIQMAFSDYVLPIIEQQSNLDSEQDILSEIRDTLLPKLLSGELTPSPTAIKEKAEKAEKAAIGLSNA